MIPVASAAVYLVQTLFSLYILAVLLRFLLQIARADFYNPISQAIVKVTDPALKPLRKIIPGFGGIDVSALCLALIAQIVALCLIILLLGAPMPSLLLMVGWSALGLVAIVLKFFFFALLAVIILSWIAPHSNSPIATLIYQLTEPVMRPARNLIPPIGGLDLSPIFIFIAISLIEMLVIAPAAHSLRVPQGLILGL